jgi:signal transduction histidine kinase/ActR/RegA family two-component response regulator
MRPSDLQQKLSDLIGFQCVLVALRGVGAEASEEMLWQTLLSELVDQYGLRRAWYGRFEGEDLCPVVMAPVQSPGLDDLPVKVAGGSPVARSADLALPVSVEGVVEGKLLLVAGSPVGSERAEQIRILTSEAATMLAERRSRIRNAEALKVAKLEAEAANRAKSLLLANMSHEIRTPMTGVLGFADLLASTQLTQEQEDYVETIRSSGETLLTLINDILDYSKIDAGKLSLESLPVDIRYTASRVIGLLAVQAAVKDLRLSHHVDSDVPQLILGDAVRLRQILMNLLGNAIKFTHEGDVSLTVSSKKSDDGVYTLEFVVRDTGPGIAPDDQKRIFDSFSQVDTSTSRKHGGTGLGLAISKALAEQMCGHLWVESELGKGATFRFTVMAQAVEGAASPAPRQPAVKDLRSPDLPALRVIVADDNQVNRRATLGLLERLHYSAVSAGSGEQLLECLACADYDVILMDVQMPDMDGFEATRRIRESLPPNRQPRIIALTASAFPEDRVRCLNSGMDGYVSKPINLDELAEALQRAQHLPSQ